ncbi:hypothetical protein Tsubulata_011159 [Turnera subulata]|uniref:Uncharacterized protein n=1 Tax=Turnera subulata TaxID=218843 RepID=A0A9Q0F721_9ROSI|nr:hypothetical protein Tsubulata_011159 [Turnera subulata]
MIKITLKSNWIKFSMDTLISLRKMTMISVLLQMHSGHLDNVVTRCLLQPFHFGMPRLEARKYIDVYESQDGRIDTLLKFSKTDFDRVQFIHQEELREVSKWWKETNIASKLTRTRNRIVELYFWMVTLHFEPHYARARIWHCKQLMLLSVVDDIYDAYGTPEEHQLFTRAIERWNYNALDELPEDMKPVYKALLDAYTEFEKIAVAEARFFSVLYTKEAVKDLVRGYHAESLWLGNKDYVPSLEDYITSSYVTTGVAVILAATYMGMGEVAGAKEFEWLFSSPRVVRATMIIARILDDIASHEFEQRRPHIPSIVQCHMKENGVSQEEATKALLEMVTEAWKDINEDTMRPIPVPFTIILRVVNIARLADVVYGDGDRYTNPLLLKDYITPSPKMRASSSTKEQDNFRPLADFPQDIWGDHFTSLSLSDSKFKSDSKQTEVLKEEVKQMLMSCNDSVEKVKLIDTLNRLGVSYHFEDYIEEQLDQIFHGHPHLLEENDYDLRTTADAFRAFRQHGYKIFKDEDGKFKESLLGDTEAILSLYEASHLRMHGEPILDEALAFTKTHLESLVANSNAQHHNYRHISNAWKQPFHFGMARLEARKYIDVYESQDGRIDTLLKFAKADYDRVQFIHQEELREISKWWKETNIASKLTRTRNRIVEVYFWMVVLHFEPHYARARIWHSKQLMLVSVIDDIYDAYGTPEEHQLFTRAIERWNYNALDELPEDMKPLYKALLDAFGEFEREVTAEGRFFGVLYTKEAVKDLVRAYQAESLWLANKYVPSLEEYVNTSSYVTTAVTAILAATYMGMGEVAGAKEFEWLFSVPRICRATMRLTRIMDDIVTHEFEQRRPHIPSMIQCYMKENGVSQEEATKALLEMVTEGWKDINEEMMRPNPVPFTIILRVVNIARLGDVCYRDKFKSDSEQTEVLKEEVKTMLMSCTDSVEKIKLIDTLNRLGVSYHFEEYIDEQLDQIFHGHPLLLDDSDYELRTTADVFRAFRQHGYKIFKDEDGKFKESLLGDTDAILSLYEAAHLRMHGEPILDEALAFTKTHLESLANSSTQQHNHIRNALKQPFHFGVTRLEARKYIDVYESQDGRIDTLLKFAKTDYDRVQFIYQEELREISKWNYNALDELPENMKPVYKALLDAYTEFEKIAAAEGRFFSVLYTKEAEREMVRALHAESLWLGNKYVPSLEEYNATSSYVTAGVTVMLAATYMGMGEVAGAKEFEWLFSAPRVIRAAMIMGRIMDDIASHEFEQRRPHIPSIVECYMKENGVSQEEATKALLEMVTEAWKDINEDTMRPNPVPFTIILRVVNAARLGDVIYRDGDRYTNPELLKDYITALFIDPITP